MAAWIFTRHRIIYIFTESTTTRKAGGLDFSAIGEKIQRHGRALIGASNTVEPWILVQCTWFENTQSASGRVPLIFMGCNLFLGNALVRNRFADKRC